jgi:molybdenum cofactor biosynthesis enzyme MoaA
MKAHNLTISIPVKEGMARCNKNCPYCISDMTVSIEDNERLMIRNSDKVKRLALAAGATSVLITGKGEPLLNYGSVVGFAQKFKEFPLEIQTNGKFLAENPEAVAELQRIGVDTFAISIDQLSDLYEFSRLINYIHKSNAMIRICVNVIRHTYTFEEIAREAYALGINQLLFRKLMEPDIMVDTEISKATSSWIKSKVD